jgi:HSP20 family protein
MGMQDEMNRMLRGFLGRTPVRTMEEGGVWYPAVDIEDETDKYVIKAELPGLKQEDIKITLNDGTLTFSGEKKAEHKEKHEGYHCYERYSGKFQRSFTLPTQIKGDKIKANFKNGILEIDVPKSEEVKPKEIEIKAG